MEFTYFKLIPTELVHIIVAKLSHHPELYSLIYALDEDVIYYKLCQDSTNVFKGINMDVKVGTRKIKWQCIYEDLMESKYASQSIVEYDQIVYNIKYPSELFILMLYEADHRPEVQKVRTICHLLENETTSNDGKLFFCMDIINRIFTSGKEYTKQILSKMKYNETLDAYTDNEGYVVKADPYSSVDLIFIGMIIKMTSTSITDNERAIARSKGYEVR